MKDSLLHLISHIESVILSYDDVNINNGGCGMVAIQVARFLKNFGFYNIKIRANYVSDSHDKKFYEAEHYSVVVILDNCEYEINPPRFKPYDSRCWELKYVENTIYHLKNNCNYNHINDISFYKDLWDIKE